MERLGVPSASTAYCRASDDAYAVDAHELSKLLTRAAEEAESWVEVLFIGGGLSMSFVRPLVEPLLHGLQEWACGFTCDELDGASLEVELIPSQVENVTETLAERAEAAAHSGCPLIRQLGEEQGYFIEAEGFMGDFLVLVVLRNGDLIAGIAVDDFSIYCPLKRGADGGEILSACCTTHERTAVDNPRFYVGLRHFTQRHQGSSTEPLGKEPVGRLGVVVGFFGDSPEFAVQHELEQLVNGHIVVILVVLICLLSDGMGNDEGAVFGLRFGELLSLVETSENGYFGRLLSAESIRSCVLAHPVR